MALFRIERPERRKKIPGYGGRYMVGDLGRVYSNGCELSLIDGRYVNLSWKGAMDRVDVAYLVARAFISNVEGRPYVVHKDGDRKNCRVENLEWSEKRMKNGGGRPREETRGLLQYTLDGTCVGKYADMNDAVRRTGLARSLIRKCAEGEIRKTHGFIFRYD